MCLSAAGICICRLNTIRKSFSSFFRGREGTPRNRGERAMEIFPWILASTDVQHSNWSCLLGDDLIRFNVFSGTCSFYPVDLKVRRPRLPFEMVIFSFFLSFFKLIFFVEIECNRYLHESFSVTRLWITLRNLNVNENGFQERGKFLLSLFVFVKIFTNNRCFFWSTNEIFNISRLNSLFN